MAHQYGESAEELGEIPLGCKPSNEMEVAKLINDASLAGGRVAFLTGAGISVDSGIPTFRGEDGYWTVGSKNYAPEAMATWNMYNNMPQELWRWYQYKWGQCRRAVPNLGHHALVRLDSILGGKCSIVTQNVDGLHMAAGFDPSRVHEIHGRLAHMRCDERIKGSCLHGCDLEECQKDPKLVKQALKTVVDTPWAAVNVEDEHMPVCQKCGVRMRPKVLWFDEHYNEPFFHRDSATKAALKCDVLVVVGTQLCTRLPQEIVAKASALGIALVRIDPAYDWPAVPAHVPFFHVAKRSTEALTGITACLERLRGVSLPALPVSLAAPLLDAEDQARKTTEQRYSWCGPSKGLVSRLEDDVAPSVEVAFDAGGKKIHFQVTLEMTGSKEVCAMLARACYSKLEAGWTVAEVIAFRDECSSRMRKGRRRLNHKVWAPQFSVPKLPVANPGFALVCAPPSPVSTAVPSSSASMPPSPTSDPDDFSETSWEATTPRHGQGTPAPTTPTLTPRASGLFEIIEPETPKRAPKARTDVEFMTPKRVTRSRTPSVFETPRKTAAASPKRISHRTPAASPARTNCRSPSTEKARAAAKTEATLGVCGLEPQILTKWQQENPKKEGSDAYERYEQYKRSATLGQAIQNGAMSIDVKHDLKKGFLSLPRCQLAVKGNAAQVCCLKRPASSQPVARPASKRAKCRT